MKDIITGRNIQGQLDTGVGAFHIPTDPITGEVIVPQRLDIDPNDPTGRGHFLSVYTNLTPTERGHTAFLPGPEFTLLEGARMGPQKVPAVGDIVMGGVTTYPKTAGEEIEKFGIFSMQVEGYSYDPTKKTTRPIFKILREESGHTTK